MKVEASDEAVSRSISACDPSAIAHQDICRSLNDIYRRKNSDYGDSFHKSYEEYGMLMACIRLEDKLNRLKQLTRTSSQSVKDESIEDTLMDLANYAIMTLIELKRKEG